MTTARIRQLSGVDELVEVSGRDPYVRAETNPARIHSTWAHDDGAVAWAVPSRHVPGRTHVTTVGKSEPATDLLRHLVDDRGLDVGSVTLPRDADRHLPAGWLLRPRNDWEWFVTDEPPPQQPGEEKAAWLDGYPDEPLVEFLRRWSPRHDAEPGQRGVLRWAGILGDDGSLRATAAHVEHVPGVPHLASIVSSGEHRGQGLGAAVTAWITRTLLAEGTGWVTLGMYSDNDVARRMYHRLGYRCDHFFTSGGLIRRS